MMRKCIALVLAIVCVVCLAGCEEKVPVFTAETNVHYSSGNTSNWIYSSQQKEFPTDETCYVRIGAKTITDIKDGIDSEITVTYRFEGVSTCRVEIADGIVVKQETSDPNVVEFTRVLKAQKEKKSEEDIVIFQYAPLGAGSMTIDVIYDDQVTDDDNVHSTIYFTGETVSAKNGVN